MGTASPYRALKLLFANQRLLVQRTQDLEAQGSNQLIWSRFGRQTLPSRVSGRAPVIRTSTGGAAHH
jgi:hypothetical protein